MSQTNSVGSKNTGKYMLNKKFDSFWKWTFAAFTFKKE